MENQGQMNIGSFGNWTTVLGEGYSIYTILIMINRTRRNGSQNRNCKDVYRLSH